MRARRRAKATRPECGEGWFVEPTVFTGVKPDMRIAQEEVFGPVLSVITFDDEEEAIEIANNTQYGLAAGVWTQSIGTAFTMAERLEAGTVWVNTYRAISYLSPFGGYKRSGIGRESGLTRDPRIPAGKERLDRHDRRGREPLRSALTTSACGWPAIPAAPSPISWSRTATSSACSRPRPRRTTRSRACSTRSALAAADYGLDARATFLGRGEMFIHGTTRAINAILTGSTARTAFLTTEGHPDILLIREGGRIEPFNFTVALPRALRPARADVRGARADRRRRRGRASRSTRRRVLAVIERAAEQRGRGGRRLPALVDRQPGARAARRRAAGASICRACRSRSRTRSTRRCASTGAPRRPASTPR